MIEQGVINLLLGYADAHRRAGAAQAAFVAAVGANVFPARAPQDVAYPFAVVIKTSAAHQKNTQGRAGLAHTSVRVDVYHQLYATAEPLADQARQALDGYRGALANGLSCLGVFQDDDANEWNRPVHSDEQGVQAVSLHLKIHANES